MDDLHRVLASILPEPDALVVAPPGAPFALRVESIELDLPLDLQLEGARLRGMLPSAAMVTGFDPVFHRLRLTVGDVENR